MDLSSERQVTASQGAVWEALNDPAVLKACIPGCESVDKISAADFDVVMTAKIGPVSPMVPQGRVSGASFTE